MLEIWGEGYKVLPLKLKPQGIEKLRFGIVLRVRWWRIFNSINKLCGWTIYSFWTYKHLTVNCAWNSLKDYIVLLFVFWYFLPNLEIILSSQLTLFRARISVSDDKSKEEIIIIIAWPTLISVHNLQICSSLTSLCSKTGGGSGPHALQLAHMKAKCWILPRNN